MFFLMFINKSYQVIIEKNWIIAFNIIAKKSRKNPARIRLIKLPKDKDVGELGGLEGLKEIKLL